MRSDTRRPVDFWPLPAHAVALVLPFLLIGTGNLVDPTFGGGTAAVYLRAVDADHGLYMAAGFLLLAGMLGLITTASALVRLSASASRPTFLRAGAILLGVWGAFGAVAVALSFAGGVAASDVGTGSPAVAADVFTTMNSTPWASVAGAVAGVAWITGMIVTGIGLLRGGVAPRWSGVLVFVSPVLMFVAGPLALGWVSLVGLAAGAAGLGAGIPALLRSQHLIAVDPALDSVSTAAG